MLETHKYIVPKDRICEFFDDVPNVKRIIIFKGSKGNLSDKNSVKCAALVDFLIKGWLNTIVGSCKEYDYLKNPLLHGIQSTLHKGIIHQGTVEKLIALEKEINIHLNIYRDIREFVALYQKRRERF